MAQKHEYSGGHFVATGPGAEMIISVSMLHSNTSSQTEAETVFIGHYLFRIFIPFSSYKEAQLGRDIEAPWRGS